MPNWRICSASSQARHEPSRQTVERFEVHADDRVCTLGDVLAAWQHDQAMRAAWSAHLRDCPFRAFRWETPAATTGTLSSPFEFVLVDSPGIDRTAQPRVFADHFRDDADVVCFENLGRDATLIVPCPRGPNEVYSHLAAFVRGAPESQQHAFWQQVGAATAQRLGERPVWLSTAGGGVAWLHARLDDRPKYYAYRPYAS